MDNTTLWGRSILVIEEQPFGSRCLQMLLEGAGAKVHCAPSSARDHNAGPQASKATRLHRLRPPNIETFDKHSLNPRRPHYGKS